jgi:valyl-tRNA synthetase
MLDRLAAVVDEATRAFEDYDYARAAERIEPFFWSFCDDYVELVKGRAYGGQGDEGAASANRALTFALSTLLRLFAPFVPFVTEEVWSWWQEGSIHRSSWPASSEVRGAAGAGADPAVLEVAASVLGQARKAKTEAKLSMRAPIERLVVRDTAERLAALRRAEADLRDAASVGDLVLEESADASVETHLAG